MKSETLLLLETILAVVYVLVTLGSSFYLMHNLLVTYSQISLSALDAFLTL